MAQLLREAEGRGSLTFGLYKNTRHNVFGGDGEVWLSVGALANNCVWLGVGKHHAIASMAEGRSADATGWVGWCLYRCCNRGARTCT